MTPDSPSPRQRAGRVRALRSDSIRNRSAIVATARTVLARDGLHVPFDTLAAEAGVGIATLYRNFPTRAELWQEVLTEPLRNLLASVERAIASPDPWTGFAGYILESCQLEADSNGYVNLMTTDFGDAPELLAIRAEIQDRLITLFRRAHDAAAIRPDLTVEDLLFITLSNSRVVEVTRAIAPTAWKRNVEFFLEAVRPEHAHPLEEPPMTPAQVFRATRANRRSTERGPSRRRPSRNKREP